MEAWKKLRTIIKEMQKHSSAWGKLAFSCVGSVTQHAQRFLTGFERGNTSLTVEGRGHKIMQEWYPRNCFFVLQKDSTASKSQPYLKILHILLWKQDSEISQFSFPEHSCWQLNQRSKLVQQLLMNPLKTHCVLVFYHVLIAFFSIWKMFIKKIQLESAFLITYLSQVCDACLLFLWACEVL